MIVLKGQLDALSADDSSFWPACWEGVNTLSLLPKLSQLGRWPCVGQQAELLGGWPAKPAALAH